MKLKANKQTKKRTWKRLCSTDISEGLLSNPSCASVVPIPGLSCSVNTANFTRWLTPMCLIAREPNQRSSIPELRWSSETRERGTLHRETGHVFLSYYGLLFEVHLGQELHTGSTKLKVFSDYLDHQHSLALSTFYRVQSGDS